MTKCPHFEYLIVIPRLRIQNANSISSPLTHGFPAMTAFTGLMWNLERKTCAAGLDLQFNAVGVVAHDFDELITDDRYASTFRLTRNPVGKDGKTAAIVEEGRMHLNISLIFAVQSKSLDDHTQSQTMVDQVAYIIEGMRIAGGSVLPEIESRTRSQPYAMPISSNDVEHQELFAKLKMRLLPGFALVERQDLLEQRFEKLCEENAVCTQLDAWLSLSRFNWHWHSDGENPDKGEWRHDRKGLGWVVPIPVGYGALTKLQTAGTVANTRDNSTEFCFVESLYGIGQWISPHRLHTAQQLLWYTEHQPENGIYRCSNDFTRKDTSEFEYDFD